MANNQMLQVNSAATSESAKFHVHGFKPDIWRHMAHDPRSEFFSIGDSTRERKLTVSLLMNRADLLAFHAKLSSFIEALPPLPEEPKISTPSPEPALT